MKLAFQLAYKNIVGAGLRTWLTVSVLSFAFVVIIFYNGMSNGCNQEATHDSIDWQYGYGQLQNDKYDPYDPFSLMDGHGVLPDWKQKNLVPILIRQAAIYPQRRMVSVMLKGIDDKQNVLKLPTELLSQSKAEIPALIGKRMAASAALKTGDKVLLRWRDKNGTYDAEDITIVGVFNTNVPSVDMGQIWIPIDTLWSMTELQNNATLFIAGKDYKSQSEAGWKFVSQTALLKDLSDLIAMKRVSGSIIYLLLLSIALLAIFDTQVLSVFRRQKEIGTYIALGMTRLEVVGLFTVEGSMNSLLATLAGCIYGIPLFVYLAHTGIAIPIDSTSTGLPMAEKLFPVFGAGLIVGTVALIVISSTIVSFLPSKKIANMDPVDALKGKVQ